MGIQQPQWKELTDLAVSAMSKYSKIQNIGLSLIED